MNVALNSIPLSVVIITKNEEVNISRALKSVSWAGDILVLDSGSQDRTCEIAKTLGARVFSEEWKGFGPQKRRGVELAKYDWILSIDADEEVSEDLFREIQVEWSTLNLETGYRLPRKSFHLGRWILHGGWCPDYQLRLFNRKFSNWNENRIHEKVIATKTAEFKAPILHYVFKSKAHQVETNNRYSTLQAEEYFKQGGRFSFFKLLTKPLVKFIECYFLKFGILDGLPGFVIAVSAGYSVFIRWVKIWELQNDLKK